MENSEKDSDTNGNMVYVHMHVFLTSGENIRLLCKDVEMDV